MPSGATAGLSLPSWTASPGMFILCRACWKAASPLSAPTCPRRTARCFT
jgi:hypothetical protein